MRAGNFGEIKYVTLLDISPSHVASTKRKQERENKSNSNNNNNNRIKEKWNKLIVNGN